MWQGCGYCDKHVTRCGRGVATVIGSDFTVKYCIWLLFIVMSTMDSTVSTEALLLCPMGCRKHKQVASILPCMDTHTHFHTHNTYTNTHTDTHTTRTQMHTQIQIRPYTTHTHIDTHIHTHSYSIPVHTHTQHILYCPDVTGCT